MSFEPIPGRKVPDIRGVLWLDQQSAVLTDVAFQYTGAELLTRFGAKGYTRFKQLSSGALLVGEWELSAPLLEMQSGRNHQIVSVGYQIDGGSISMATAIQSSNVSSVVSGVVLEPNSTQAVVDAVVHLHGSSSRTTSDGRFSFDNVPRGQQRISFTYPDLADVGVVALERVIEVERDTVYLTLVKLGAAESWNRLCGDVAQFPAHNAIGVVHGFVTDRSGKPIPNAEVEVRLRTNSQNTTNRDFPIQNVQADGFGHYAACGIPEAATGAVHLKGRVGRDASGDFDLSRKHFVRRDLSDVSQDLTSLRRDTVQLLPTVTTSSDRDPPPTSQTRHARGGVFLGRGDIVRLNKSRLPQLLQSISGVAIQENGSTWTVRLSRCGSTALPGQKAAQIMVFLDGTRLRDGASRLSEISPADIDAIEIFTGVAELPPEALGDNCGAIFVWLRH